MLGKSRKPAPQAPRSAPSEASISIIGPGMYIEGDLATEGTVRIEGSVRGTVRAGKSVLLGKNGEVIGDVITGDAVLAGRLVGSVVAETRLELQSTCVIEGEIRARAEHLQLAEGARFSGQIQMLDAETPVAAIPAEVENREPEPVD